MPANLTPQYQKAEQEFRRAQTTADQIECLQRMLQLIPRHKGTERLQASLKTRLKEARQQLVAAASTKSSHPFRLPRQGAGRVVIIGPPNCGKSRILAELTRATPDVSPWPFTTREPLPGMLLWRNVQIQLIDTPAICAGSLEPWQLNLIRTSDGVLLVMDGSSDDAPEQTATVFNELAIRKTRLSTTSGFDDNDFAVLNVPSQLVVTHADAEDWVLRLEMLRDLLPGKLPELAVELDQPETLHALSEVVFQLLQVIRIYTRRPGETADMSDPLVIPAGSTVEDLALSIHEDLFHQLKHARIWRDDCQSSKTLDGLTVGRQYVLQDRDVVELH